MLIKDVGKFIHSYILCVYKPVLVKNQTVFVNAKMFSWGRGVELVILYVSGERGRTFLQKMQIEEQKAGSLGRWGAGEIAKKSVVILLTQGSYGSWKTWKVMEL